MRAVTGRAAIVALLLLGGSEAGVAQETGRIVGRVFEQETGRPVTAAELSLSDGRITITGTDGRFEIEAVTAGNQEVSISVLGYEPRRIEFLVPANNVVDLQIPIKTDPLDLEPIEVTVRNRWLDINGFYKRREVISGTFMTRPIIEEKNQRDFVELFRGLPGIQIDRGDYGNQILKLRRGYGSSGEFPQFQVYIDGIRTDANGYNGLSPMAIEAIEVFKGANVPVEYGGRGVILVWTRGS